MKKLQLHQSTHSPPKSQAHRSLKWAFKATYQFYMYICFKMVYNLLFGVVVDFRKLFWSNIFLFSFVKAMTTFAAGRSRGGGGQWGRGDLCTAVGSLDNNGVLTWRPPPSLFCLFLGLCFCCMYRQCTEVGKCVNVIAMPSVGVGHQRTTCSWDI